MKRLPDWERRLAAYIRDPARQVFAWGTNDCALFVCGAIEAMTGEHPFPEFVGQYDTREGAAKALRDLGKGTLISTFNTGFARKKPPFAQRGDVVMSQGALGICLGAEGLFLQDGDAGYSRIPRAAFVKAWAV